MASLRQYLLFDREGNRFNESAVGPVIEEFQETVTFAKLGADDGRQPADTSKNGNDHEALNKEVQVGSFVQWTSQDVNQFQEPRKVTGVDGDWAFVEGSETGLPMSELTVVDPLVAPTPSKTLAAPPLNPNYKPPAPTGPRIEFPLPDDNSIEIRLRKPVSKKDFDRIKKLVELSEESLVAPD